MRLAGLILVAYVALGLQRGLDAYLSVRVGESTGVGRADLVLVAALLMAVCLPASSGPLAAVVLGLVHDVTSSGPIGARGVAYGLAALLVTRAKPTSFSVMAIVLPAAVVVAAMSRWIVGGLFLDGGQTFVGMLGTILLSGLLVLVFAWPIHRVRPRLLLSEARR